MDMSDQVKFLLRKNGFTFDEDGGIDYPRGGDYYFQQNLILSLYVGKALHRNGKKYRVTAEQPAHQTLALAA